MQFVSVLRGELAGIDQAAMVLAQADRLLDTPLPPALAPEAAQRVRDAFAAAYEVAFRWGMGLNVALAVAAAAVGLAVMPGRVTRRPS